MHRILASFACLALPTLVACGAADDAADKVHDATSRAALAAGSWHGTWTDDSGRSGIARFEAEQDGLSVTGKVTFEDNPCFDTAVVHGDVDATKLGVSALLSFGDADVKYEASLEDGTSLDGGFESLVTVGVCAGIHGNLKLSH